MTPADTSGPANWQTRAIRAEDDLQRIRDGLERILATTWDLEQICDRLAATSADPIAVAAYRTWKAQRS